MPQQIGIMHSQIYSTVVVIGRIGIVDVALIRYLEGIKEITGQLLVHVTESIHDGIIPKTDIEEFVASLSIVDGILEEESELKLMVQQLDTTLKRLLEEELQHYTHDRILKKVGIENRKNKPETIKLTNLNELVQRYGNNPHKREINIGLVSGSFDLIHLGHLLEIKAANETTDVVIVATMSTNSLNKKKIFLVTDPFIAKKIV